MSILIRIFFALIAMAAFSTGCLGSALGLISNMKAAMMLAIAVFSIVAVMMEAKSEVRNY